MRNSTDTATAITSSQPSLWDRIRGSRRTPATPVKRSVRVPAAAVRAVVEQPSARAIEPGVDLMVVGDTSGKRYRMVGSLWCGSEQEFLFLVESEQVEQPSTADKHLAKRENVRVAGVPAGEEEKARRADVSR